MTFALGTRSLQGQRNEHPPSRALDSGMTRDVGLSKLVTSSATFTAADSKITGANGDFTAFAVGDPIIIRGSNTNDGERIVTGVDATSQAFLVLDAPPKDEGPVSVTVRTI